MAKIYYSDEHDFLREREQAPVGSNYSTLYRVKVDSSREYQTMLGFGAAMTSASCYVLNKADAQTRERILREVFTEDGIGLNMARVCVGSSDYADSCYCYNDVADDVNMEHFSIEPDMEYVIPVLQETRNINPDILFYSSPWSPPGWMKTGGSMCGGWLRGKYVDAFVQYYLHFLLEYQKQGIPMYALTPQNECETDQSSLMPASLLHPEYEMEFTKKLKALMKEHNLDTKIWIHDHNYSLFNRVKWMLDEDEDFRQAVDGVAFHIYEGDAEMMSRLHKGNDNLDFHITEGGPNAVDYETCFCEYATTVVEAIQNWCSSITVWNTVLYEDGTPNIGPFGCRGLVTLNQDTNEITYSGHYKTLAHFTKFLKPGAKRIHTEREAYGMGDPIWNKRSVDAVAFRNTDGSIVAVLVNPKDRKIETVIEIDGVDYRIPMKEKSLCTLVIEK